MSHTHHWHLPHLHKHGHKEGSNGATHSGEGYAANESAPSHTKVAIAGITGKLGRLIAKHLLATELVEVHGIARNPDKLADELKSNSKVTLFKSDMIDVASLRDAVKGCSILISVVLSDPTAEVTMQKAMIDACVAENVPRFMPNEFTLDWRCIDLELLPTKKVNQAIFEYIEQQNGKVQGVHVLIGGFMETIFSGGFLFDPSKSPAEGLSTWGTGDDIWELTSYNNAAQWTAAAALDPTATGFLKFLGDRVSAKEIAKTLQDVYELPAIPFTSKGSLVDLKAEVKNGMEKNANSKNFWDWKGKSYTYFLINGEGYLEVPLDNAKYIGDIGNVMQEQLEDWLQGKELKDLSKTVWF